MSAPITSPAFTRPLPALTQQATVQGVGPDGLRKQAKQLEGLFLNTLVSQMLSSTNARGMFGGGYAEETWKSMQAEQISNQIAESGGIGLADTIMQNLLTLQGAEPGSTGATKK